MLTILAVSCIMGLTDAFAQEYPDNNPQELQIISLGNYDLEIKLPVFDGEDFGVYADFNEAINLQNLRNYILVIDDPLDELEFLKSEINNFSDVASQEVQDTKRWNSSGEETLEYGIEWTYLRAFNDMERIINGISELVNDGMSLDDAFAMYDYILPPSAFENQTSLTVASDKPSYQNGDTTRHGFEVRLGQETFDVEYEMSGGSLYSIIPDDDFQLIELSINTDNDEILVIELPRDLIDSKFNGKDSDFIILVDGNELNFTEIQTNSQSRTLSIELDAYSEEIEIIGSTLGNDKRTHETKPSIQEDDSLCPVATYYDSKSNSCKLVTTQDMLSGIVADLKQEIRDLKLENHDLKQQVTSLNDDIEQLEDLLLNGLKEIYAWMS